MRIDIHDVHNVVLMATEQKTHGTLKGRSFLRQTFAGVQNGAGLTIFVADGAKARARRQVLFSGYKAKRPPMTEDKRAGIELFKSVMHLSKAVSVCCPGWEADDTIATIAKQLAGEGHEVFIHTNDGDFGQLKDYPGIQLPRLKTPPVPPVLVPLYKALVGDPSDNIPGLPGFGPETFRAMQSFWPLLERALREDNLDLFVNQPWPRASLVTNILRPGVWDGLKAFYLITHFMTVPADELEAGTIRGSNRPDLAEEIFQRYLL